MPEPDKEKMKEAERFLAAVKAQDTKWWKLKDALKTIYHDPNDYGEQAGNEFFQIAEDNGFDFTNVEWLEVVRKEITQQEKAYGAPIKLSLFQILNKDGQLGVLGDGRNAK